MIKATKTEFTKNEEVLYDFNEGETYLGRKSLEFLNEQKLDLEKQLGVIEAKINAIKKLK